MCKGLFSRADNAASFMASEYVGCGWLIIEMSSHEALNSIAVTPSIIKSAALAPII